MLYFCSLIKNTSLGVRQHINFLRQRLLHCAAARGTQESVPFHSLNKATVLKKGFPKFLRCSYSPVEFRYYSQFNMSEKKAFKRLTDSVVPKNYAIKLKPDIPKFTFEGSEDILISVSSSAVCI